MRRVSGLGMGVGVVAGVALWAVFAAGAVAGASAAERDGSYIVVLKDSVAHPANVAARHEENRDAEIGHVYGTAIKGYSAALSAADLKAVKRDPSVAYVERDVRMELHSQTVSTGFKRIHGLNNPSLDIDEKDDVQVNVDVAVIDTGVDFDHPDLRVVARTNCMTGEEYCVDNTGDDTAGHGTHVAGIIGAKDNTFGVVGVAPGARIWSVKAMPSSNGDASDVIAGVNWVTAHAGQIEVANMSLGCDLDEPKCNADSDALNDAITGSINAGVVYVVSAGNDSIDADGLPEFNRPAHIPAAFSDPITVSNLSDYDGLPGGLVTNPPRYLNCFPAEPPLPDEDDTLEANSNWGTGVDIAAPGTCIYSTYKDGEYKTMTGTSQAAPHVAGAAAILAAMSNPNSREDVMGIRKKLRDEGNTAWTDDGTYDELVGGTTVVHLAGPDGVTEPLLSIDNESVFKVPHPGNISSVGVTSHTPGAMQLYARTETGAIAAKDYNPYANPWGWQPWGNGVSLPNNGATPILGAPAVISREPAGRDIFVRGTDNQLYFRNQYNGAWTTWFQIPRPNNAPITSAPAAVANAGIKDALTLVVRGSSNQVFLKNYDPAYDWSAWLNLGAPPGGATSAPAVTIHDYSVIHVMVRGGDNAVWDRNWSASAGWSSWGSLGGVATSAPAVVTTGNQKDMWMAVRGTDNGIWYRRLQAAFFGWGPWNALGGNWISEPSLTRRDNTGTDVFAVGTDGKAQHKRFIPQTGQWTAWMRVDDECPPGAC